MNNKFSNLHPHNNDIILYTSPGNFDDDVQMEKISLIKTSEGMMYFKLNNGGHVFQSDTIPFTLNHREIVEDVNNDGIDDIILCAVDENREDLYIFTFDKSLKTIFSPGIANKYLNSSAAKTVFSNLHIYENLSKKDLIYESYCVEVNYGINSPYFICEGQISSGDRIVSSINTSVTIDASGEVFMKEITN
jgi:hypothetical protein